MYKTAREIMKETLTNEISLALLYIEIERQMFCQMRKKNDVEIARLEGIMEGILTASRVLGNDNLYSKTITNLRNAIQDEQKEYKELKGEN